LKIYTKNILNFIHSLFESTYLIENLHKEYLEFIHSLFESTYLIENLYKEYLEFIQSLFFCLLFKEYAIFKKKEKGKV
jgi:hypothetical protein